MKKINILLVILALISFSNCNETEDNSYKYKTITSVNNTDRTVTVYYAKENNDNDNVTVEQKDVIIPSSANASIEIQHEVFKDGQFSVVYNNAVHTYDVNISSDADETINIEISDF